MAVAAIAPSVKWDANSRESVSVPASIAEKLVFVVFVAHMFLGRPPVETLLFSIALAVGLSPELPPRFPA